MRRASPSSPCRDLLPADGEKDAVIRPTRAFPLLLELL